MHPLHPLATPMDTVQKLSSVFTRRRVLLCGRLRTELDDVVRLSVLSNSHAGPGLMNDDVQFKCAKTEQRSHTILISCGSSISRNIIPFTRTITAAGRSLLLGLYVQPKTATTSYIRLNCLLITNKTKRKQLYVGTERYHTHNFIRHQRQQR